MVDEAGLENSQKKEDLIREIIQLGRQVSRVMGEYVPDAWMELSLSVAQLKSLFFISKEGSTNFRKLAQALRVTPSNVTGIVDHLVEEGLVSRQENPEDRRMLMLQLTDKGKALLASLRERRAEQVWAVLSHLSEEQLSTLLQGFRFLTQAIQECENESYKCE
jgi:DNA-binding MarR family transcriptional regulator